MSPLSTPPPRTIYRLNVDRVQAVMLQRGWSVKELAKRCRTHTQRMYRALWGQPVTIDTITKIAKACGVRNESCVVVDQKQRPATKEEGWKTSPGA
jgi:transcriptional regulator with XRE-family HTH domain